VADGRLSAVELDIALHERKPNVARGYWVLSLLGLVLTLAFLPMLIRFELMQSDAAVTSAKQMVLCVSLAIYFAILIIPGRGFVKRRETRWLTPFLLILAGFLVAWGMILIPLVVRYLRVHQILGDESLLFISRMALVQAAIGMLALGAKGVALAIPYVKRFTAKLSELTWFR